ncbi:MAG TPA: hotdog domain-containing protein [Gammaproteobacteria bacterium]
MTKFTPQSHHCAGPTHFVNGGIIATVIDCHCVCTAAAAAYRDASRDIGSKPDVYFATAKLALEYMRPTPIDAVLEIRARIEARTERTYVLSCHLSADGKPRVKAQVEAIRVPDSWMLDNAAAL